MDVAMVKVVMYSMEWNVISFNIDYVSIRVCMYVCMYWYVLVCIGMHVCMYVCMCMYVCVCMYVYVCVCMCMYVCMLCNVM